MNNKLNDQQLKSVTYPLEPVMVMAGAGTGKTTILTKRIGFLIKELNLKTYEILAITFTNKASKEMNNRISKEIGKPLEWIGTFHSICIRILSQEIHNLGRNNNFKILDEEECLTVIKNIYEELLIDKKDLSFKNALLIIDKLKTNCIEIDDLNNNYQIQKKYKIEDDRTLNIIKKIYPKYLEKFENYNYLDFNDILNLTNIIFENFPQIRNKWSNKFKYILIDEFQDTNFTQFKLIEYLGGEKFNVFAVGDEDQIIYTFRGADNEVINKFVNHFPNKKIEILKLEENYRSTNQILNVANSLIDKNKNRVSKNLFSYKEDHIKPLLHSSNDIETEANYVSHKINELIEKGVEPKEIAVLYRSNYLSRAYEQGLIFQDIKYNLFGGFKFYQRSEIKDILAYLQVIDNQDELSLLRIINLPRRKISDITVKNLLNYSHTNHISLWESLMQANNNEALSNAQKNAINDFVSLIKDFQKQDYKDFENYFQYIINKINYLDFCKNNDASKIKNIEKNLEELKNSIINFKNKKSNWTLSQYLQEIALYTSLDDRKQNDNAVNLMTIHSAKGLEFEYVFLVSFNDGIFPSIHSIEENSGLIEERRLAYVAITRAKKELYICTNSSYNHNTQTNSLPSRFINDIDPNLIEKTKPKFKVKSNLDLDFFDSKSVKKVDKEEFYNQSTINDYKIGDRLVHVTFGEGVVIGINNDILDISFKSPHKIKSIIYNHKAIKRQIM